MINNYISEKLRLGSAKTYNYCCPKTKKELCKIIGERLVKDKNADLNDIDVSKITDMSYLFAHLPFNGDISEWNVENVTDMNHMFMNSNFAGDISDWKVNDECYLYDMFKDCPLEQCPPKWYLDWKHKDLG